MNKILIIAGTDTISGAEFVLKDYCVNTNKVNLIDLICSDIKVVESFYKGFIENVECYKELNPVKATKKYAIKNKIKKIYNIISANFKVNRKCRSEGYKVVLGNNTRDIVYSAFIPPKVDFYLQIHDMIKRNSIDEILIKLFNKRIKRYIVVSKAIKESLINIGIEESKIILIYNGMNYKKFIEKNKFKSKLKIGFIGALIKRKSPDSIINICKNKNIEGNIVYHHYDDSIYNNIVEQINNNDINITLLGKLEREEVEEFIKKMDFILTPSIEDPLPTVILESFNNSTPVIGRNIDGIPEMITDGVNGFLFDKDDELERIVERIFKLDTEQYLNMCKNANDTILNNFEIKKKVEKLDYILFS